VPWFLFRLNESTDGAENSCCLKASNDICSALFIRLIWSRHSTGLKTDYFGILTSSNSSSFYLISDR